MIAKAKGWRAIANDQGKAGYVFIMPSVLVLLLFVMIPLICSIVFGFFKFNVNLTGFRFIGLDNFTSLAGDHRFWNSLKNTVYFTVAAVPLQIVLSLLVAMAISKNSKLNVLLRSVFFLPVVCSMTVVSLMFVFLLNPDLGGIAQYVRMFGFEPIDWLKSEQWAMPTVIMISVWKSFGFTMVILLAALQGIPDSHYEAAELDGANKSQRFQNITLPHLMPTIGFVAVTTFISSFQVFDQVFIMTQGGPLFKTETMVQYIYYKGFTAGDMGFASANAFVLFLIILAATLVMLRFMRKSEENY